MAYYKGISRPVLENTRKPAGRTADISANVRTGHLENTYHNSIVTSTNSVVIYISKDGKKQKQKV